MELCRWAVLRSDIRMSDDPDEDLEQFELAEKYPPGPEVTRELFLEWRSPRYGRSNPERMDNPVWEWLVRSRLSAFYANDDFKGPSPFDAGPGWCFKRFGQSKTTLPDGRIFLIAGEHEDGFYQFLPRKPTQFSHSLCTWDRGRRGELAISASLNL
jgi:hypothetical protein